MLNKNAVIEELKDLPEDLLEEVWDFVKFLKTKALNDKIETVPLSESALRKDWMRPEEDEAWRDL